MVPFDVTVNYLGTPFAQRLRLGGGLARAIVSRRNDDNHEISITWNAPHDVQLFPVLDRAHFPVTGLTAETHPHDSHRSLAVQEAA